ncbi:MAG: hypothetical protein RL385_2773 [Pseudomonadota bacterium]
MANATTLSSASSQSYAPPTANLRDSGRSVLADPGPWLVLLGPISLVLTLVAVIMLSRGSF